MQDGTQPSALGLLPPALQNEHPHPILIPHFSLAYTDPMGIALLAGLPSREPVCSWGSLGAGRMVRNCLSQFFFLARIVVIITGAGLSEENMSLGHIPRDLVNSSPADTHIFI